MEERKADLHNHLKAAGRNSFNRGFDETIDLVVKKLGPGGIFGITDFNDLRYEDFIRLRKTYNIQNLGNAIYVPEKEILIIRGQEVLTKNGHLLVLGTKEKQFFKDNRTLEDSLKQAKDNNTIIIAPHPFFIFGLGNYLRKNQKLLKYFHGFEVHNGQAFYGNKNAKMFYDFSIKDDYDIGALSSSDGNSLKEIGSSYTFLEKPNIKDLIGTLKRNIKNHKDYSKDKQHFSFLGSLEHSIKTIINQTN